MNGVDEISCWVVKGDPTTVVSSAPFIECLSHILCTPLIGFIFPFVQLALQSLSVHHSAFYQSLVFSSCCFTFSFAFSLDFTILISDSTSLLPYCMFGSNTLS
ncbi:hypothetical protein OS493_016660 [Desmophyllum pertusum]|uniref:Uncharacterized protein n=1 Tax=Desmophyllum pertusum TaxID=174260 RepID=A0A9X0CYU8_9CNID|nr:hypothetical protein OS493_016660 [Desmophyllum pertusum]